MELVVGAVDPGAAGKQEEEFGGGGGVAGWFGDVAGDGVDSGDGAGGLR